ncbi:hypothetical protein GCM10018954_046220 [Kutzneria kofuensis]
MSVAVVAVAKDVVVASAVGRVAAHATPPPVATTTAATMMITRRLVRRSRILDNTGSSLCSHPCPGERGS